MKSLAESILSSTGSGKNKKIDVEYLLKHGFERDIRSPRTMFKHKETGYTLVTYEDKILLYTYKNDGLSTKSIVEILVVSTIGDLDLVIEWFKMLKYNDSKTEQEKLRKELFKQMKEI